MSAPKVEMDTQDTQLMSMEKRRGRGGSSGGRDRGRDATRPCCYVTRRRDASRSDRGRTLSSAFTSPRDAIWDTLPFGVTRAFELVKEPLLHVRSDAVSARGPRLATGFRDVLPPTYEGADDARAGVGWWVSSPERLSRPRAHDQNGKAGG